MGDGLYLCGDKNAAKTWHFDLNDIIEQGLNIDGSHFGIKYIMSGRKVQLKVYDGPTRNTINHGPLEIGAIELGFASIKEELEDYCTNTYPDIAEDRRKAVELNNGRAAQMGILALMVHEKLDNNPYIINSLLGAPVAFN